MSFAAPIVLENVSMPIGSGKVSSFTVTGSQITVNLADMISTQAVTLLLKDVGDRSKQKEHCDSNGNFGRRYYWQWNRECIRRKPNESPIRNRD